ncbi:MAG TPA: CoA transferase [Porticoccaceae bacterium]|jgi:crotonobetainyl-CoA:carnitine CoA-transferase CaiB-like acyl-CoA transferase|nr:CoA transferase [Porticoccaceae bacterium]
MAGPLKGYRVLDMSRILAGPWAGQLLADLGADVIKIERPGKGDDTRHWGPPYLKDTQGKDTQDAAYFFCANRGKKSVCVDITQTEGQKIIRQLIEQTDVLIENYKVGGLAKYGLDYTCLSQINPKLVYCSITGFGQTGPYAQRPGYDFLIQGMGGLMSVTGEPDHMTNGNTGGPVKVGVAVTDIFTGLYAANAIQAALLERHQSGKGQYIDLALLDVQAAVLANQASNYLIGGQIPERLGNAHPNIVPYQAFATKDSHIIIAVGNDAQFRRFCEVLQQPLMATDPLYTTNAQRVKNRRLLSETISHCLKQKESAYWLQAFEQNDVPCGPINSIDQVFDNPQIVARNMLTKGYQARSGEITMVANPINFSRSSTTSTTMPEILGESTNSVLTSYLEYSEADLEKLRKTAII